MAVLAETFGPQEDPARPPGTLRACTSRCRYQARGHDHGRHLHGARVLRQGPRKGPCPVTGPGSPVVPADGRPRHSDMISAVSNYFSHLIAETDFKSQVKADFEIKFNVPGNPVVARNSPILAGPAPRACLRTAWPCRGGVRSTTGSASTRGTSRRCAVRCRYPVCAECGPVRHQTAPRPPVRHRSGA